MKYKWYQFNPMKSFLSLAILWVVVISFFSFATIAAGTIVLNSNLELNFSYQGFNQFVTIFKVPLGILALVIPVVALLAANHRSEQTKAQISSNSQQNKFSNYFKHVEEFEKYVDTDRIGAIPAGRATSGFALLHHCVTYALHIAIACRAPPGFLP